MYGWMGQILKIDVSDGSLGIEPTEPYIDHYLGGRGIGVRLIYDLLKPGTDGLSPENPLIFSMGPLSGTAMPSSGRTDVTALSPLSNLRSKSNFGGYWGPEAKYAGYDHIIDVSVELLSGGVFRRCALGSDNRKVRRPGLRRQTPVEKRGLLRVSHPV